MDWQPIETAPMNGTPVILAFDKPLNSSLIERFVPWDEIASSMGWWEDRGWVLPFIEEGSADSFGYSPTFYMGQGDPLPVTPVKWMPLPDPPKSE